MCVFKVGRLCLAGTIKHMARGEDGQLWLRVCLVARKVNDLKRKRVNNNSKNIQRLGGGGEGC